MIPNRDFYIQRYIAFYLTRYPKSSADEIAGSQAQYTRAETFTVLAAMVQRGMVVRDSQSRGYTYSGPPMVVQAPAWAVER
jgi:hypothetical protein